MFLRLLFLCGALLAPWAQASEGKACLSDVLEDSRTCMLESCSVYADAQNYAEVLAERDAYMAAHSACLATQAKQLVMVTYDGDSAIVVASLADPDLAGLKSQLRPQLAELGKGGDPFGLRYASATIDGLEFDVDDDVTFERALMLAKYDGEMLRLTADEKEDCDQGDVQLVDGQPWMFWNGHWEVVCGHYFWDNDFGATAFCKKLGYTSGTRDSSTRAKFDVDALHVGLCQVDEGLHACSGNCNSYTKEDTCGNSCKAGEAIGFKVTCSGGKGVANSCTDIIGPDAPEGYERVVEGCVNGNNIVKHANKSVEECADLCDAEDACLAFEYGVPYGGGGAYKDQDCQLQSSDDAADCDGSHHNLNLYIRLNPQDCDQGDVQLVDGQPWMFWDGHWEVVCGHYFWDNDHGATAFCKKLGYASGKRGTRTRAKFDVDALHVGLCQADEGIHECSGNCNSYTLEDTCGNSCKAGEPIGLQIECSGGEGVSNSCTEDVEPVAPEGYERIVEGCVSGANIIKHTDKSVEECADLCDANDACLAFEYGVAYGGKGGYKARDCQLQSSASHTGCDGAYHNLDLYVKLSGSG